MADEENHINKNNFKVPFVCGCRNLGEALRRIAEGAAMLRTKGEAGTGNIVEAMRHARAVSRDIKRLTNMDEDELFVAAKVSEPTQCSNYLYNRVEKLLTINALSESVGDASTIRACT